MQEPANENQQPQTPQKIAEERWLMDIEDYEKSFALLCKIIDEAIFRLKASHGKLTPDQLRSFLHNLGDATELAIAMSPMDDYTKVNTGTFNCRVCKKVVWDDGTSVRYCPSCIRSTRQAGSSEVSQGTPDQTSAVQ